MIPGSSTPLAAALLAVSTLALANLPPVETTVPYRLLEGSTLTAECLPCAVKPITVVIRGGFRLRQVEEDPLWARHAVLDFLFFTPGGEPLAYHGEGHGTYAIGGEVALLQEMRLETVINDQTQAVFSSEPTSVQARFPWIEIDLFNKPEPGQVWSYRLHLVATPWARLRFSTASGFHTWTAAGGTVPVSGGDLLAPAGRVVRTAGRAHGAARDHAGAARPGAGAGCGRGSVSGRPRPPARDLVLRG